MAGVLLLKSNLTRCHAEGSPELPVEMGWGGKSTGIRQFRDRPFVTRQQESSDTAKSATENVAIQATMNLENPINDRARNAEFRADLLRTQTVVGQVFFNVVFDSAAHRPVDPVAN